MCSVIETIGIPTSSGTNIRVPYTGWTSIEATPVKVVIYSETGTPCGVTFKETRESANRHADLLRLFGRTAIVLTAGRCDFDGNRLADDANGYPEWYDDDGRTLSDIITK